MQQIERITESHASSRFDISHEGAPSGQLERGRKMVVCTLSKKPGQTHAHSSAAVAEERHEQTDP